MEEILNDEKLILSEESAEKSEDNIEKSDIGTFDFFKEELREETLKESKENTKKISTEILSEISTPISENLDNNEKKDEYDAKEIIKINNENYVSLNSKLEEIFGQIQDLNQLFETRIAHTEFEENSRKNMHNELLKYRDDMYGKIIMPILSDIITLRNDMEKTVKFYANKPKEEQFLSVEDFSDYIENGVDDILEKYEVEIFKSQIGDEFSSDLHQPVSPVTTDDEKLHGKIAESVSAGYKYQGRTFKRELVKRFVYKKEVEELQ